MSFLKRFEICNVNNYSCAKRLEMQPEKRYVTWQCLYKNGLSIQNNTNDVLFVTSKIVQLILRMTQTSKF